MAGSLWLLLFTLFYLLPPTPLASLGQSADLHFQPAPGLSYDFYESSCPRAYEIIEERVKFFVSQNPSQAAGILRIMFHDCFVQGCDASILLLEPATELTALPNNASIRLSSLRILNEIKESVEAVCPGIVSCADVIILAATYAVHLVGGPFIPIATGRRDGFSAASNQTITSTFGVPAPTLNISALKQNFQNHGLDVKDLVSLSGGHTIGQAHCRFVDPEISPSISTDLNFNFAINLSRVCLPANNSAKSQLTVHLDFITMDFFDNAYFKNILSKRTIFHSDATLLNATDSSQLVEEYANDQVKFFAQFTVSMFKMSQLGLLTGKQGEIRKKCTVAN